MARGCSFSSTNALFGCFAVLIAFSSTTPARADDVWTHPYPGVRHLHRVAYRVDLHAVLIDLDEPSVSLIATRPEDRRSPVRDFAMRYDADIAINANYFDVV